MIKKKLTITITFSNHKAEEVLEKTKQLKIRGVTQAKIYLTGLKVLIEGYFDKGGIDV